MYTAAMPKRNDKNRFKLGENNTHTKSSTKAAHTRTHTKKSIEKHWKKKPLNAHRIERCAGGGRCVDETKLQAQPKTL